MNDELRPYPAYKDSGVPWLGRVPGHWRVSRLKRVCRLAYGDPLASEDRKLGQFRVYGSNGPVGYHDRGNTLGPCIVVGRKGSFGKVQFSEDPVFAIDTTYFVDSTQTDAYLPWLYYVLTWAKLDDASRDSAIPGLDREEAYGRLLACPPPDEQKALAEFLNASSAKVNRFIRNRRRLIEVLNEQKQAIIHRAVTRGLDDAAPLKPSGKAWFPNVPAHWAVVPMRRAIQRAVDGPHHSPAYVDQGYMFISARNVKVDRWSLDDAKRISKEDYEEFSRRIKPEVGDVLYTKGGTTGIARVVDLDFPFQVWVHIAVLKLRRDMIMPEYLALVLNSPACYEQAQLYTRGATNQDLGLSRMKGIEIPLPPTLDEQRAIVQGVQSLTRPLAGAIATAEREIALIREYRTRLIADVVTGQVDVRHLSPPAAADAVDDHADADAGLADPFDGADDPDEGSPDAGIAEAVRAED